MNNRKFLDNTSAEFSNVVRPASQASDTGAGFTTTNDPGILEGDTNTGTGGFDWGSFFDMISNGVSAYFGSQSNNNYNTYPQTTQTDYTRVILYGMGGFMLLMVIMIFFIKLSK